jgi:cobalt-zinc-cadmium efflux system protein
VAAAEIRTVHPDLTLPTAVRSTGVDPVRLTVPADELAATAVAAASALLEEVDGTVGVITPVPRRDEVVGWLADLHSPRVQVVTSLQAKGMEYDGVVLVAPGEIRADPGSGVRTLYVALPGHPAAHYGRHDRLIRLPRALVGGFPDRADRGSVRHSGRRSPLTCIHSDVNIDLVRRVPATEGGCVGAGHDHHGSMAHTAHRHLGRLAAALALLTTLMLVEAATAFATGSLALLSDAGHMFTDVLGIGMALAAITATRRAGRDPQRTFGLYRLEVLAALANAVLLRGGDLRPVEVRGWRPAGGAPADARGRARLLANVAAFALLRSGARESINLRGAYLEVLGDLLGSVGVITAAVVIELTDWWWADPLVAVAIGGFILPRTWRLGRAAVRILVQAAPEHLQVTAVRDRLAAVPGVRAVHDLHVWTLTSGMEVASAHLTLTPGPSWARCFRRPGAPRGLPDRSRDVADRTRCVSRGLRAS